MFFRKPKLLSAAIAEQLRMTEEMLLEAEGELENAIGRRDTLARRRERLYAALGPQEIEDRVRCPHGIGGAWSDADGCPDCNH